MAKLQPPITLFSRDTRDKVHAKNHLISIKVDGDTITGAMTNEFSFDVAAQWEPIFSAGGVMQSIEEQLTKFGVNAFKSGIFTRKFYKGGSYIEFSVDFRITDWDGKLNNSVVRAATVLTNATLPTFPTDIASAVTTIYKAGANFAKSTASSVTQGVGVAAGAVAKNGTTLINTLTSLGAKEVEVTIGNYWRGLLIIESVSSKYSREQTETGPLYGDFTVKFSTREIFSKGSMTGFQVASGRVTINR